MSPDTHVITTGATLLGMMDLALLLCKLVVWKDCTLSECLPSMVLLPCRPSKEVPAETVCWAVLAVVPIVCRRPQDPRSAGKRAHSSDGWETQEEAISTVAADTDSRGHLPYAFFCWRRRAPIPG